MLAYNVLHGFCSDPPLTVHVRVLALNPQSVIPLKKTGYIQFFLSVFGQISKANHWPPKAAGKFVVFLTKFLKQMLQNFGISMSIYIIMGI